MNQKAWNVKHIQHEIEQAFAACHTDLERQMCAVYIAKDVRQMLQTAGRELTPAERAICDKYNINIGH